MSAAPVHLAGERFLLDPLGGAWWPAERALAVADLHLEKGSAAARGGRLLPPWDTAATLDRLSLLLRRYAPARVLCLGDSFHDGEGRARMAVADVARLAELERRADFVWVAGNHDGGSFEELAIGPVLFRHIAQPGWKGAEISGHYHPKARVPAAGTTIARACFATDGQRLILPALGAYAGGLELGDPAYRPLFPRGGRAFLLGRERLFSFRFGGMAKRRATPDPDLWESASKGAARA
jgi:uncharacterized protein